MARVRRGSSWLATVFVVAGLWPLAAAAEPTITEFALPAAAGQPLSITIGPDGNLWFTEDVNRIGRMTPAGVVTEFTITSPGGAIVTGPDGNLWFVEGSPANSIGSLTPDGSVLVEYDVPTPNSNPDSITVGPDGALWFTEFFGNKIGRITTNGVFTEFPLPEANSRPLGITVGPDGNLWFTEFQGNRIGRITPTGVIAEFPVPTSGAHPSELTTGSDGNLWFLEFVGNKIGRISPAGAVTEFPLHTANAEPFAITADLAGNLWFTEGGANRIGRITRGGTLEEFDVPTVNSDPAGITRGPDGRLWFTEFNGRKIARLSPALVRVSPRSGVIETTQHFDLTIRVDLAGFQPSSANVVVDGADVTPAIAGCAIVGTIVAGGATVRCPGLSGGLFDTGAHTLGVFLGLTDGSVASDTVIWEIEANHEP